MKPIVPLLVLAVAVLAGRGLAAGTQISFPQAFVGFAGAVFDEPEQRVLLTAFAWKPESGPGSGWEMGLGTEVFHKADIHEAGAEAMRLPRVEAAATPPAGGTLPKSGQGATRHAASTFFFSSLLSLLRPRLEQTLLHR